MKKKAKNKKLLEAELQNMKQGAAKPKEDTTERERMEEASLRQTHQLNQRMKELQCLFSLDELMKRRDITAEQFFKRLVQFLPAAMQYPTTVGCCITFEDKKYKTDNFKKIKWCLKEDIVIRGSTRGSIEVCHLQKKPEKDEEPFLREERELINSIAKQAAIFIEGRQTQEKLVAEMFFSESLINTLPGIFYLLDDQLNLIRWNTNVQELLERSAEEISKMNSLDFFAEEDRPAVAQAIHKTFAEGQASVEAIALSKSGRRVPFYLAGTRVQISDRQYLIGIGTDITERKKAEDALKGSEERLRNIFDSAYEGIMVTDLMGNIIEANENVLHLHGYESKAELLRINSIKLIAKKDRARLAQDSANAIKGGRSFKGEYLLLKADGTEFEAECHMSVMYDSTGKPVGLVGVSHDITDRKQAEEALRKSEEKWHSLVTNAPDIIINIDRDHRILFISRTVAGFKAEDVIGKSIYDFTLPEYHDVIKASIEKVFKTGEMVNYETMGSGADGKPAWYSTRVGPIRSVGEVVSVLLISNDITERKRAEETLRKSEEKIRDIFESTYESILVTDNIGNIIEANEAIGRSHGYTSKEELIGKNSIELVAEKDRSRIAKDTIEAVKEGRSYYKGVYTLLRADGTEFEAEYGGTVLYDISGKPSGYIGVSHDITDRKRAEAILRESEKSYRTLFESTIDGMAVIDAETAKIVIANETARRMYGFDSDEDLGQINPIDYVHPDDRERAIQAMAEDLFERNLRQTLEFRTIAKGGEMRWISAIGTMIEYKGRPAGLVSFRDTTEQKLAQEALRETAEKLQAMFDSMGDAVTVVDLRTKIVDVNKAAILLHGYGREEDMIGLDATSLISEKDRDRVIKETMDSVKHGTSYEKRHCALVKADGVEFDAEISFSQLFDASKKLIGFLTISNDITERKRMMRTLQETMEKLQTIFNSTTEGLVVVDLHGNVLEVNESTLRISGYSRENLIGRNALELIATKDRDRAARLMARAAEGKVFINRIQLAITAADGTEFDGEFSIAMLRDASGKGIGYIGAMRDITEQKRAQEALRASEEKYRDLVENTTDVIYTVDENGGITYMSPAIKPLLGYNPPELTGKNFAHFIHPDDLQRAIEGFQKVISGHTLTDELRGITKSGGVCWFRHSTRPIMEGEHFAGAHGILTDITDRRQAEDAIRESEEKLRLIFASMVDGVIVTDMVGKILSVNDALCSITRHRREELLGKDAFEIVSYVDRDRLVKDGLEMIKGGKSEEGIEYKFRRADGEPFNSELRVSILHDAFGKPAGFITIIRDITQRKRAEETLRESERRLKEAQTLGRIGNWEFDIDRGTIEWSDETYELYERDRALGPPTPEEEANYYAPEQAATLREHARRATETGEELDYDLQVKLPSGRTAFFSATMHPLRDESGRVVKLFGTVQDITERKQAEIERERLLCDLDERVRELNCLYGISNVLAHQYATAEQLFQEILKVIISAWQRPETVCARITSEGEEYRTQNFRETPWRLSSDILVRGKPVGAVEVYYLEERPEADEGPFQKAERDLIDAVAGRLGGAIERKRAKDALLESEDRYRSVVENANESIVVAQDGILKFFNPKALELTGYSAKELVSKPFVELIHPDDRPMVVERHLQRLKGEKFPGIYPFRIVDKNGFIRWVEIAATLIDWEGRPATLNFLSDITERKQAEETLRESEIKYHNLFEEAPASVTVVDLSGIVVDCNEETEKLTGHARADIVGKRFDELMTLNSHDLPRLASTFEKLIKGEVGETYELEIIRKDGERRWIRVRNSLLKTGDEATGIQVYAVDITEQKMSEIAIRESEERYRDLFEGGIEGMFVMDAETMKVALCNKRAARIYGYDSPELAIGTNPLDFIHPDDRERARRLIVEDMFLKDLRQVNEFRTLTRDGEEKWISAVGAVIDYQGKPAGLVSFRDITEQKRAQEEIKRQTKRSEALYAITQSVSKTIDLDALANEALKTTLDVMGTEVGGIYVAKLESKELVLKAHSGVSQEFVNEVGIVKLSDEELARGLRWTEPVFEPRKVFVEANLERYQHAIDAEGLRSIIIVPFWSKGIPQGGLVLADRHERKYSSEEIELLKAMVNEIAIGIENATLLEKTKEMSVTDELTGIYNRRHFYNELDTEIHRMQRYGRCLSIAMLDLDGFKNYNDTFGHANGDVMLRSIAQTLKISLRKSDTVFRYGGDEFIVILPGTDAETAKKVIDRIRSKWEEIHREKHQKFGKPIGFSTGIAQFPDNAETPDGLVFLTDAALFYAKRRGGAQSMMASELNTLSPEILSMATREQVYALSATVDAKDPFTYGHSNRVAAIAETIAKSIGMSGKDLADVYAAAILHDIGKLGVPDAILTKPSKLTDAEWKIIYQHPVEGAKIIVHVKELSRLIPMIRHHHEWYNGTGYPDRLKGDEIPLGARIISVADAYDTMTTKRLYRNTITPKEALKELKRCSGSQFDPKLVQSFFRSMEKDSK